MSANPFHGAVPCCQAARLPLCAACSACIHRQRMLSRHRGAPHKLIRPGRVQHVLLQSQPMPEGTPEICGHDFEQGRELDAIMAKMATSGFQATKLGEAIALVNEMVRCVAASDAAVVPLVLSAVAACDERARAASAVALRRAAAAAARVPGAGRLSRRHTRGSRCRARGLKLRGPAVTAWARAELSCRSRGA